MRSLSRSISCTERAEYGPRKSNTTVSFEGSGEFAAASQANAAARHTPATGRRQIPTGERQATELASYYMRFARRAGAAWKRRLLCEGSGREELRRRSERRVAVGAA